MRFYDIKNESCLACSVRAVHKNVALAAQKRLEQK
jgi:hypothetical protein